VSRLIGVRTIVEMLVDFNRISGRCRRAANLWLNARYESRLRVYTSDASMAGFDSAQKIAFAKVMYCGTVLQSVDASVLVVVYVMAVPAKPLHFLFHCRYRV
jgi:hypothetical protein